jgi:hypothetical protein
LTDWRSRAGRIAVAATLVTVGALAGGASGASEPDPGAAGQPERRVVAAEPGAAVTVSRIRGGRSERCPKLTPDGKGGGCTGPFVRSRGQVDFTIRTLAGDIPFASCLYNYFLRVDGDGRTSMDGMISAGENPCNDVRPCVNRQHTGWLPWSGRIRRLEDGSLVHRVDACIDTCLGQFKGLLVMRLARHGRTWRATSARTQVGDSGFVIGGATWGWKLPGLEIATARQGE